MAVVVVAVLVAGGAAVALGGGRSSCGGDVTSLPASRSSSPFLDADGREQQPDEDRDRAVASLGSAASPFGEVVGAVGYHYEQWAQISAYAQGIGIRTRDNPDFTMLDDHTTRPLWSVQVGTRRSAYDADDDTYLVATMPKDGSPDLVALDADTGKRRWCAHLGGSHVGADDPFATLLLDDGGLVVLGPGKGEDERVVRFDRHGKQVWAKQVDADHGDFLGGVGDGLLVAGGRPQSELTDGQPEGKQPPATWLQALDLGTGQKAWRRSVPEGTGIHVLGVAGGRTLLSQRSDGEDHERLIALDEAGKEAWTVDPRLPSPFDATLRAGRVLVRSRDTWAAYDAATGRLLWRRTMPTKPQFLPYGFQLDDVPLLDDDHALLGTTTGLRMLDLRSGRLTATAPLPTDGINTTFWPYQVAVSPDLVAVATNTGAVVLRRAG